MTTQAHHPVQLVQSSAESLENKIRRVGVSTGYMTDARCNWKELIRRATSFSTEAIEISALSQGELPSFLSWAAQGRPRGFGYISVHGPTKSITLPPLGLAAALATIPTWVESIVLHPDTLGDPAAFRGLGSRLVIENMDFRKRSGRTVDDLDEIFHQLPEAGFCLDLAHARSVDPSLRLAHSFIDRFHTRLRQFHVSSLDEEGHHITLLDDDVRAYQPLLDRCPRAPIILEAAPHS